MATVTTFITLVSLLILFASLVVALVAGLTVYATSKSVAAALVFAGSTVAFNWWAWLSGLWLIAMAVVGGGA